MIKAVCFDWFNTLAYYHPPREEIQSQALREFGFSISPQQITRGLLIADSDFFEENSISPIRKRSLEEQARIYARYQQTILAKAGIDVSGKTEVLANIMKRAQQLSQGMSFVLYDDVLPAMKALKEQKLILGLLTNLDRDMQPICHELGLESYISFTVTSGEAGADKPKPPIFLAALQKAGVKASEAVHVGDQYKLDIVGARAVGINPILIDRNNINQDISDCPRINSLTEIINYL